MDNNKAVVEEAIQFVKDNIVGKTRKDFELINEREKHFLFNMRNRLDKYPDTFMCSEKQLRYMKRLIEKQNGEIK